MIQNLLRRARTRILSNHPGEIEDRLSLVSVHPSKVGLIKYSSLTRVSQRAMQVMQVDNSSLRVEEKCKAENGGSGAMKICFLAFSMEICRAWSWECHALCVLTHLGGKVTTFSLTSLHASPLQAPPSILAVFPVAAVKDTLTKRGLGKRGRKGLLCYRSRENTVCKDRDDTEAGTLQRWKRRGRDWGCGTSKPIPVRNDLLLPGRRYSSTTFLTCATRCSNI